VYNIYNKIKQELKMTRKIYTLTEKDLQKCKKNAEIAAQMRSEADANKEKLKKRYGLKCRDAAAAALKGDPEYFRGIWQGRIDFANGLKYSEERSDSAYNLGYYRGYTDCERDIRGGLVIPAEYLEVK